jgi:hypothetical protein
MTAIEVLVKNAPSRNLVSEREPLAAPQDPYAAGCPTRLLLDRIGDKWMVLTLGLIRDRPRRSVRRSRWFSTGSSSGRAITSPTCSPPGGVMTAVAVRAPGKAMPGCAVAPLTR